MSIVRRIIAGLATLALATGLRAVLPPPTVFETKLGKFSATDYAAATEALIARLEKAAGVKIAPGPKHKVGLKVYAESGPGLATPVALTQAVIAAMERRGFAPQDVFLVGLDPRRLRDAGYLPALVTGKTDFKDQPVFVLDSGKFYDPVWYYDSPLPSRFDPVRRSTSLSKPSEGSGALEENRKSFLATPLFLEADFWINLPVYTDHPTLGVNGALVNATLWNASNTERFFSSGNTAPEAVADMAAIPELRQTWAFTIVSLERYQFVGGPGYNSLYTRSESLLWLSADPVLLDSLMLDRFNLARKKIGFKPEPDDLRLLEYAARLGIGSFDSAKAQMIPVPW